MRVLGGFMRPYGPGPETPVEERFFAGGNVSVRGWGRQLLGPQAVNGATPIPLGGDSKLESSVELRYPIVKDLGGVLFLDAGNVWAAWNGIDPLDLHYALGIGLRYQTPIGPFRIDMAWKLNTQYVDERLYRLHLSIGQAF